MDFRWKLSEYHEYCKNSESIIELYSESQTEKLRPISQTNRELSNIVSHVNIIIYTPPPLPYWTYITLSNLIPTGYVFRYTNNTTNNMLTINVCKKCIQYCITITLNVT